MKNSPSSVCAHQFILLLNFQKGSFFLFLKKKTPDHTVYDSMISSMIDPMIRWSDVQVILDSQWIIHEKAKPYEIK